MKLIAFTDLHAGITAYKKLAAKIKKHKPDALLCCGDFTIFEQNITSVLTKLAAFKIPLYLIHGNHEQDAVVQKLCKRFSHVHFVHKKLTVLGEYLLVAHGGGGFYGQGKLAGDKDFDNFILTNTNKLKRKIIFMTHAPPAHTKLDHLAWLDGHVGCTSYTAFIKKYKPILALSGHLHENFGVCYKLDKTTLCNPGPEGIAITL